MNICHLGCQPFRRKFGVYIRMGFRFSSLYPFLLHGTRANIHLNSFCGVSLQNCTSSSLQITTTTKSSEQLNQKKKKKVLLEVYWPAHQLIRQQKQKDTWQPRAQLRWSHKDSFLRMPPQHGCRWTHEFVRLAPLP